MQTSILPQSGREIQLSLAGKDYSGTTVTYNPQLVKLGSLESILKSHNYSPISWYDHYRDGKNFKSATGFCVDSDHGMTIEQALEKLQQLGWNYALITTRSHKPEAHRFRIYVPFNKTVYSYRVYRVVIDSICAEFPQTDESVLDRARQLFGSPADATYHSCWNGNDFDVEPFLRDGEWDKNLRIFDGHKQQIDIHAVKEKTVIHCPFHEDGSPSAFIDYNDGREKLSIYCSACNHTFWMIKEPQTMEERCKGFYSLGSGFYELTIVRGEFSMIDIGEKKVGTMVHAVNREEKAKIIDWIVNHQHFKNMNLVEQVGDMDAKKSYYEPLIEEGMVRVHHGAIPAMVQDNEFIEKYFADTFGENKDFIKQWLAVYCYTNYRKLPFLILTGIRGTGKNSFAELVGEIYKPLVMSWSGRVGQFTPEYEKKLLIADETVTDDPKQYLELKRLSGLQDLPVNKKHQQHYQVRNNLNVIILSNAQYPIQVERDEVPTSENDNQFFVYKLKKNYNAPDARFGEKLKERIGHYIRTKLKTVYDGLDMDKYRYSIPVPITEYEKELFASSVSPEEDGMDKLLLKLKGFYSMPESEIGKFLHKRYVPTDLFEDVISVPRIAKHKVVKLLRGNEYLTSDKQDRPMVGIRKYCYTATDKLMAYMETKKE